MSEDKVIQLKNPGSPGPVADVLTEVLREGAQRLLANAIEAEVAVFLEQYSEQKTLPGLSRMVRNGYLPGRAIQTGVGSVEVRVPRVRDRRRSGLAHRFCRPISGAPRRWKSCCLGCI